MGRIHVLSEHVANKIAAGEVVERPASVVKELLENSLDAGAERIRIRVEAGGKKLIHIIDDGAGMVRDDAMLAFERHATSKIKDAEDLLNISTLGFRGEGLPSIAAVSRLTLETCAGSDESGGPDAAAHGTEAVRDPASVPGTRIEIAGGKLLSVEEVGLPQGTSIAVRELFFNTPARKKFLRAESTELSHIASLVTHYALAHPEKHFELHSGTNAMLVAPPVKSHAERIYQVFGKDTLDQLVPVAAEAELARVGLPQPAPWTIEKMRARGDEYETPEPGTVRLHGFVSKPEVQKLNRNSIFVFVNGRLIRDRLVQHALTEAYRNILPPTVHPVVLLFLELPPGEVDCNVHPSKTEVRFRQQTFLHDFVRESVRETLMRARPVPQFTREISAQPTAGQALTPGASAGEENGFALSAVEPQPMSGHIDFSGGAPLNVEGNAARAAAQMDWSKPQFEVTERGAVPGGGKAVSGGDDCASAIATEEEAAADLTSLASLKALGQVRESFILAVNHDGLWIIDQHVAHERVLFEKILRERERQPKDGHREGQRLLMPLIIELTAGQLAIFSEIADELHHNGFEVEPFGARTIAVKTAPAGLEANVVQRMLTELLEQFEREQQSENLEAARTRIAASIACHAAIKINTPLEPQKMEWLLQELAKTECPFTCPHGRPVVLRYSLREIQRAFKRI